MKLWNKGGATSETIVDFTVGNDREMDRRLAIYDVRASQAHANMLADVGLITKEECLQLKEGFERLEKEVLQPDFRIPEEMEDIHSFLEFRLTEWYGDTGKKVHTARSRNDQVLTALHLYLKEEMHSLSAKTREFAETLCDLADKHASEFIPGYTHTQVAMPSSAGMWLAGYAECLADDILLLQTVWSLCDQNPLGTAAGFGSTFPIDRLYTTSALDFGHIRVNPVAAQLNRGKLEQTVTYALGQAGLTLSKLANDCVWFLSQNLSFISFPDSLTTGSSIMPHKKNPDVFELVRAKGNQLGSISAEINALTRNLFSGYHRDFQLLKEPLFRAIDLYRSIIDIMQFMLPQISVNAIDLSSPTYQGIFSVDAVAKKVEAGYSFREAYIAVGTEKKSEARTKPLPTTHTGSLYSLDTEIVRRKIQFFSNRMEEEK